MVVALGKRKHEIKQLVNDVVPPVREKKMMWFVCMEVPEIYFLLRWHRNFRGRFWKAESYFFVEVRNLQATQIGEAVEQDSHVHAMELSFFKCVHQVPLSCWRFGGGDMGQDIIRCTKTLKWAKA